MQRGIVRNIDDLGRIVIPKEFRRLLKIIEGEPTEIFCEGEFVKIRKYSEDPIECNICGSEKNLNEIDDKFICEKCIKKIKKKGKK